jgi:putative DNA primase/helicase
MKHILNHFEKVKHVGGNQYIAQCPAHEDTNPSLSIKIKKDKVLIHCHAGCDISEVLAAVNLDIKDLFLNRWGR